MSQHGTAAPLVVGSRSEGTEHECGRIAVVGDPHSCWDEVDVRFFNDSSYDQVWVTGDLGGASVGGVKIARSLGRLRKNTLVMLGNHDVEDAERIMAELTFQSARTRWQQEQSSVGASPPSSLPSASVSTCGYSSHSMSLRGLEVTLIGGRPFSVGGPEQVFADALRAHYGVESFEQSIERLRSLIDRAPTERLIFLAHNGPSGLGEGEHGPFALRSASGSRDWGDTDLAEAVSYARERGHFVLAVVAGHMHWQELHASAKPYVRHRDWQLSSADTLFVNAARVPRHEVQRGEMRRHHVALSIYADRVRAQSIWVQGSVPRGLAPL